MWKVYLQMTRMNADSCGWMWGLGAIFVLCGTKVVDASIRWQDGGGPGCG
jgi:hypothetical protein